MPVSDGGFAGAVTETGEYRAMGQYGTAGVVGYAAGSDFRSMVYGGEARRRLNNKHEPF